jgi:predicted CopG family antitoxin
LQFLQVYKRTIRSKMTQNETNLYLDPYGVPSASNCFYMRACNNYFEDQEMTDVISTFSERRKRLRLKRIVVSEHNYLALKRLGHAGDSFNDVISKLLRIHRNYLEKQQQQDKQEENNSSIYGEVPFPRSIFELLQKDRQ